jgi:hypothetical protein
MVNEPAFSRLLVIKLKGVPVSQMPSQRAVLFVLLSINQNIRTSDVHSDLV